LYIFELGTSMDKNKFLDGYSSIKQTLHHVYNVFESIRKQYINNKLTVGLKFLWVYNLYNAYYNDVQCTLLRSSALLSLD